jgi:hypothetical protein
MRALRWLTIAAMVGAVLSISSAASADGGSYIELDRTHYLAGETAVGRAYVSVPERKQGLFERGPFYAFVVPKGAAIREGRPIPDGAIRAGVFSVEPERGKTFELRASFTVPDLPGDFYSIAFCNDPCTISGFREPLTGVISIVGTVREGQLLTEQSRLDARIFGVRRHLRKAERAGEDLQAQLDASEAERSRLASEVSRLEDQLAAPAESSEARSLIDVWAAVMIVVALLGVAGALVIRRRRPAKFVVPDTIEELERVDEQQPRVLN